MSKIRFDNIKDHLNVGDVGYVHGQASQRPMPKILEPIASWQAGYLESLCYYIVKNNKPAVVTIGDIKFLIEPQYAYGADFDYSSTGGEKTVINYYFPEENLDNFDIASYNKTMHNASRIYETLLKGKIAEAIIHKDKEKINQFKDDIIYKEIVKFPLQELKSVRLYDATEKNRKFEGNTYINIEGIDLLLDKFYSEYSINTAIDSVNKVKAIEREIERVKKLKNEDKLGGE